MVMDRLKFTLTAENLHPSAAVGVAKQLTALTVMALVTWSCTAECLMKSLNVLTVIMN
jgi:hypothetical protein